jgi:GNAT superfamily N-acetyltransferase
MSHVCGDAPHWIRPAVAADASDIAELLDELGYSDDVPIVRARLERLTAQEDAGVVVAVIDGTVAAVAAYQLMELLERREPQCRITTLVVRAAKRRRGLATALVTAIESIAAARGCFRLEVTTGLQRRAARDFYLALGFQERPRRLVKPLGLP